MWPAQVAVKLEPAQVRDVEFQVRGIKALDPLACMACTSIIYKDTIVMTGSLM